MNQQNRIRRANDWHRCLSIERIRFPASRSDEGLTAANNIALEAQFVGVLSKSFPAELTTERQADTAGGKSKQRRRINIHIEGREFRYREVSGVCGGETYRQNVRRDRPPVVSKGVVRN